jgi:hypothetical protein
MSKRIFYLSDHELQVILVKGKTLTEVQRFQSSDDREFANYLSSEPKTPIYWLVDTAQEEYQITTMPHVWGKDHRHLMTQKMIRLFKNTPYTYGVVQGRETQGRRDDRILFMALNNPAFLQPWLNLIGAHKVPLIGIYSLPLLSQGLLKHLPKAPYILLLAHTPAGLRQSFFIKQQLQFSRLISLNTHAPQEYANEIFTQITRTQHYLNNVHKLSESLSVIILTDTPSVFNTHTSSPFNLYLLDSRDFAHQLGLQGQRAWYLHHFVALSRIGHTHYAVDTRYLIYRKVRIALYLISVLLLSGAAVASLKTLENALVIQQKGYQIAEKTLKLQAELEQLNKPDLPLDILLIRSIVELSDHLKVRQLSPRPAWEKLSHVLSRYPDLFLERLEWDIENPLDESKHFIERMKVHGKIKSDDQNALQIFEPFVNDLRQHWVVDVLLAPYDPKQILQGQIGSQVEVDNAPFVIDILIKHTTR